MKTCYKCKETKSTSEFYKNKKYKDGLCGQCKDCDKTYNKEWKKTPNAKYINYNNSAKDRGYEFNLSLEEFTSLLNQDCHYCGQEGFGVDRFDNSTGYTSDNCVPCCTMCNKIKSNHDYDDLMEHIELMLLKDSNIKGVF